MASIGQIARLQKIAIYRNREDDYHAKALRRDPGALREDERLFLFLARTDGRLFYKNALGFETRQIVLAQEHF